LIGTDIEEVVRFENASESLKKRVFTDAELEYASKKAKPAQHLTAAFAAKEACWKALGLTWGGSSSEENISWKQFEIGHLDSGQPVLLPGKKLLELFKKHSIQSIAISLSHTESYGNAVALLIKEK
jgi:holo-[acyl-carrier protein] synthase